MEKKSIRYYTQENIYMDGLPLGDVIKGLQKLSEKFGDKAEISLKESYGDVEVRLYSTRLESDDECIGRMEREARHKDNQIARDKMEYERLKKIFQAQKE